MKKFTLTLILNKDKTKVLMCKHQKFHKLNFIGGKIDQGETVLEAHYRELFEETGIRKEDTRGLFVFRHEVVELYGPGKKDHYLYPDYNMYISIGVMKHDVELRPEKNPLIWVDINDKESLLNANGDGNCYVFLKEGLTILQETGDDIPDYDYEKL